ncbi:MAG: AMP-binding protein [Nitratireductor sp.]|nr:AMP-binding protein [Nitratireductor sp.]
MKTSKIPQLPEKVLDGTATLPGLLRLRAETGPDRLALREKDRGVWKRVTWAQYYSKVRQFALFLQNAGFGPGDILVIASDGTPEWFYADMAAQALGGTTVGIYPTNPWSELQYITRHCRAKVAVCGDQEQTDKVLEAQRNGEGLPDLKLILTVDWKGMRSYDHPGLWRFDDAVEAGAKLEHDASAAARLDASIDALNPEQDAIIVYTSGTTGMPKGARISHRNVIFSALTLGEAYGFADKPMSALCYLPLCHMVERLFSLVVQLVWGGKVSFAESIDTVAQDLVEIAPSYFLGVPRIWEKLQYGVTIRAAEARPLARWALNRSLEIAKPIAERSLANGGNFVGMRDRLVSSLLQLLVFRNLRAMLGLDRMWLAAVGGAPISTQVVTFFRCIGVPLYQVYGMTETSGLTNVQVPGHVTLGCAGQAVRGIEQRLDEDGELLVRGEMVFQGYLHDEEATRNAVVDGWLHTGDIAEFDEVSGEIRIIDRKKAVLITSGGKNITPSLIENSLKDSMFIDEAVLLGDGRNFLAALIQIDFDMVGKWAQEHGYAYTNFASLAGLPEVHALIEGEVAKVNALYARVENVRKFVLLTKQLDHDDGETTATMKVRRSVIEKKFAREVAEIYGEHA